MTVKELKEFLESLPDDAQCFVAESYCSHTSQNYWETAGVYYDEQNNEVRFA